MSMVKVAKKVSKGRKTLVAIPKEGPLEDLFPHIFTWVCEPKEASYGLIRKYIAKHYPKLSPDAPFKKAMANMVAKVTFIYYVSTSIAQNLILLPNFSRKLVYFPQNKRISISTLHFDEFFML